MRGDVFRRANDEQGRPQGGKYLTTSGHRRDGVQFLAEKKGYMEVSEAMQAGRPTSVQRNLIRTVEGLDLPVEGAPEQIVADGAAPDCVALMGIDYPGLRPVFRVEEGDRVKLGQSLFEDRKCPAKCFTSPAAGVVRQINRGARRSLLSVVIERDGADKERFDSWDEGELATVPRDQIVGNLCVSGLWAAFRTRPFGKIPNPTYIPSAIFVTAIDTNPLAAKPLVVIDARISDFIRGLKVVARLTGGSVHLCHAPDHVIPEMDIPNLVATAFSGPHPAGLAGTHIHFLHPVGPKRNVWRIGYQDVIAIGVLAATGYLDARRVIALAGPQVARPRLIRTTLGASLSDLTRSELRKGSSRVISGSVLSGRRAVGPVCYLGRFHDQVSVLDEVQEETGPTFSSYVARWLNRGGRLTASARRGAPGPIFPLGGFERVMPLDILATPLLRALLVQDLEMAQGLGALELEEEDLALCSFVCPGKIDYSTALRICLDAIERGD
jgi:Na+-transporting NADH:ubiquinone oxidoreductase subunit A